jgi:predicted RNA-binding protein YlxR (DUF448 family)/ribosomal protein L7Ae-like RNA K-turn-binding protein
VLTVNEETTSKGSERTCAGCRAVAARGELVRFVHVEEHTPCLVPDLADRLPGRGVSVHPTRACLSKAVRGGFARSLKRAVQVEASDLEGLLRGQYERRLEGLLLAALRRRKVALGTDAAREALTAGAVSLLLVAKDAAGRRDEVCALADERAVRVVEVGDKSRLGHLTGKETLGLIAVLDRDIAREIAATARALGGLSEDG